MKVVSFPDMFNYPVNKVLIFVRLPVVSLREWSDFGLVDFGLGGQCCAIGPGKNYRCIIQSVDGYCVRYAVLVDGDSVFLYT